MDDLFAIDRQAREQKMDHVQRDVLRQQYAPPLLEPLRGEIRVLQKKSLPKSAAGQAANYTLSLWTRLTLFLKYPELELSNSPCRELHATDCHRKAQLAALGEQRGWPKDRCHLLSRRELPPPWLADPQLSRRHPAGARQ
jgi:hypothetical protein